MDQHIHNIHTSTHAQEHKSIVRLLPLLLLLLVPLIVGVLIRQSAIFQSRATADSVEFVKSDGTPITVKDGNTFVTDSLQVKLKLNAPPAQ